jgi:hypothetical protein
VAELAAADPALHQHRHAIAEVRFELWMGVDVDLDDRRAGARSEWRQCRAHVVAQMTIRANEERQHHALDTADYSPLPSFSVV